MIALLLAGCLRGAPTVGAVPVGALEPPRPRVLALAWDEDGLRDAETLAALSGRLVREGWELAEDPSRGSGRVDPESPEELDAFAALAARSRADVGVTLEVSIRTAQAGDDLSVSATGRAAAIRADDPAIRWIGEVSGEGVAPEFEAALKTALEAAVADISLPP